jgi:hypothetical protein
MATEIYKTKIVKTVENEMIYLTPLKIKYLRQFMTAFKELESAKSDMEAITVLTNCATICMQQYYPSIKTQEELEDMFDINTIYDILEIAADIKIREDSEETVKEQAEEGGQSWDTLDLVKLETEVFLLGIWKDFEELETSLSMPELIEILNTKRDLDYEEKRFLAGIQGVDIDKGNATQDLWEQKKAKFFSGGATSDGNDVVALQGANAAKVGFGIGMGLDYAKLD